MVTITPPSEGITAVLDLGGQPMTDEVYEAIYAFLGTRYTLGKIVRPEETLIFDVTRVKPNGFGVVGSGMIPEWGILWKGIAEHPHSFITVKNIGPRTS